MIQFKGSLSVFLEEKEYKHMKNIYTDKMYCDNASLVGGKGRNLFQLKEKGFHVPRFYVVGAVVYEQYLQCNHLFDEVKELCEILTYENYQNYRERIEQIRQKMRRSHFPIDIEKEMIQATNEIIEHNAKVAVRSSFGVEDGEKYSCAGIFDTFLNVNQKEILNNIVECYLSLWEEKALAYMLSNRLSILDSSPCVIIMRMIQPVKAGVAFSCNVLTGNANEIVVNAKYGLGEDIVSGLVEPEQYIVKNHGYKLETNDVQNSVLTKDEILELGWKVYRIFSCIGNEQQHQDVEWAYDGVNWWILQTRPVVGFQPRGYEQLKNQNIWTNANMKEIMPGAHSYLSWSTLDRVFENMLNALNVEIGAQTEDGIQHQKLFSRHPYMNMAVIQYEIYRSTGVCPDIVNECIGGHQGTIDVELSFQEPKWKQVKNVIHLFCSYRKYVNQIKEYEKKAFFNTFKEEEIKWAKEKQADLLPNAIKMIEDVDSFAIIFEMINLFSGLFVGIAMSLYGKKRFVEFIGNECHLISSDYGKLINQIGIAIKKKYTVLDVEAVKRDKSIMDIVERFIRQYGHRGIREIDLLYPRWRDNTEALLQYAYDNTSDFEMSGTASTISRKTRRLHKTKESIENREYGKNILVRYLYSIRLFYMEVGKRLVEKKIIKSAEDIFYLYFSEVHEILMDSCDGCDWMKLIEIRREELEVLEKTQMLDVICDQESSKLGKKRKKKKNNKNKMTGIAISNGVVEGRIKMIQDVNYAGTIQKDDIIVVPVADISWTPLFISAGAIIMEVGGFLSHGANIAREYHIPAVANIPDVMKKLKEGQKVIVNGTAGTITILEDMINGISDKKR